MSPYVRLGELLLKWEELRKQGQTVSPEEVCRDCPELADDFKRLIASLESRGSAPSAPSATAAAPPTPLEQASGEQPATAPQPAAAVSAPTPKATETAAPPSSGNVRLLTNSIGMKLLLIPPGDFQMGSPDSDPDADTDEKPCHRVRISKAFYLGACPVTLGQMRAFVGAGGYRTDAETDGDGGWGFNPAARKFEGRKPHYTWQTTGWDQSDNHPVINVSWNDARAFCAWLSAKERRTYRLPTEAEWEYACRAGTTTRFYGDNHVDVLRAIAIVRRLVPGADAFPFTAPVGRMKANAFGLHDMHGNVWEWCADWYAKDYYKDSTKDDPAGPPMGGSRVIRGGCWSDLPKDCRAAERSYLFPRGRDHTTGFRVVCELA